GVLCAAEAAPWLRDRLTEAVHAAARDPRSAPTTPGHGDPSADTEPATDSDREVATETVRERVEEPARECTDTATATTAEAEHTPARERASTTSARPAANATTGAAANGRK